MAAIDALRDDGLAAILVTGRILDELDLEFPQLTKRFDAVVAENGAVLMMGRDVEDLAPVVDDAFAGALRDRHMAFRRGRVLLACDAAHAATVIDVDGSLGLDYQIVRNRGALMVLPAGLTKGTGLLAALAELGVSVHNTLAVGDAENELALLEAAELGLAVANAVPSLREHADLVLEAPNGASPRCSPGRSTAESSRFGPHAAEFASASSQMVARRPCPPRRRICWSAEAPAPASLTSPVC